MSQFLALMHCRVPCTINAAKELMEISGFEVAKIVAERRDLVEEFFVSQQAKDHRAIDIDKFLESLNDAKNRFTIEANPKIALAESLSTARTVAGLLAKTNWCLCRAPENSKFITSDSPLCVFS
jgi:enolase